MSFDFKKLSDVSTIEEVKDGLSVLAVDNNEVVKVAADKIGGVSGGGGGCGCGAKAEKVLDIQWDGNPEGHIIVDTGYGGVLVRVSDETDESKFVGATVKITGDGLMETYTVAQDAVMHGGGELWLVFVAVEQPPVAYIVKNDDVIEGIEFKAGTYMPFYPESEPVSFSIVNEIVHQIDPKFIPNVGGDGSGGGGIGMTMFHFGNNDGYMYFGLKDDDSTPMTEEQFFEAFENGLMMQDHNYGRHLCCGYSINSISGEISIDVYNGNRNARFKD